jgi:hypothetical protein
MTVNGGTSYHAEEENKGAYKYKRGFNLEEIKKFVEDNLNMTMKNNPLLEILHVLLNDWTKDWTKEKKFGVMDFDIGGKFSALKFEDIVPFFNKNGNIMRTHAKWWKSNILYSIIINTTMLDTTFS